MLENIFGSRTRVKLLKLFLNHPEEKFFVRELSRAIEEKINSVRRELENLERVGLIKMVAEADSAPTKKDKKKFYTVDTNFILYPEFKNLILKSRLLLEKSLVQEINNLGKIKFLMLTGFFVDNNKAKTDLLVVGNIDRQKLKKLIAKMEKSFEQEIRFTVMSTQEFNYRNQITDKFLFEVLEGKKIVLVDNLNKE
ncbi:hypothetical protein COU23_01890 [Candidatus Kuenenbacteria bacterium CG10_big_fil_rev_8_21_14_0_10_36_11]|uniref:HTH arsR-type domain-containing protein n=1 Tax=Candidatus Kuenenbacteria bacterium CG10_big_fil_rev_8_21_14_0_10_36_11 TaxID=1974618 RepID=A0A2M6WAJ0_9BACT|nr:MAG: hypothetical protein COU23_01890 [Candidatus Kuenenbacteria bacterium CG10_big_fil_rev_8_21_14_0_10_36_11]